MLGTIGSRKNSSLVVVELWAGPKSIKVNHRDKRSHEGGMAVRFCFVFFVCFVFFLLFSTEFKAITTNLYHTLMHALSSPDSETAALSFIPRR